MATIAEVNFVDFSDLDQSRYSEEAQFQFREESKWAMAISLRESLLRGQAVVDTIFKGFDVSGTAYTPGASVSYTTPTESQVTTTLKQHVRAVRIDGFTQIGGIVELINAYLEDAADLGIEQFDYDASAAAILGTNVTYVGQTARASITATDTMTLAQVKNATRYLDTQKARKFTFSTSGGVRSGYMGMIHPDVKYDLSVESSGIFTGMENVNAEGYQSNMLGYSAGVFWVESNASPLLIADGGAGAVDVYCTEFIGQRGLGMVEQPTPRATNAIDISVRLIDSNKGDTSLNGSPSIVARFLQSTENMGLANQVGFLGNFGMAVNRQEAIYRVESAASKGANT